MGGIQERSECLDYEFGPEIPFCRGLRYPEGMPDCGFEHERDLGKNQPGQRCGARDVHGVSAVLCKSEASEEKTRARDGYDVQIKSENKVQRQKSNKKSAGRYL